MDWKRENLDASTKYPRRELEKKKREQDLLFMACCRMPESVKESPSFAAWSSV
jgi:hypothetical protein